jgi:hypothetical protein
MRYEQWRSVTKWAFLALVPVLAVTGCGTAKVNVSGKVSYKNTPLKGGTVTFTSTAGKGDVTSRIAEDGTYTLERCSVGPVIILVETESLNPQFSSGGPMAAKVGMKGPPTYAAPSGQGGSNVGNYTPPSREDNSKRYVAIPPEYADPSKSKLKYEVKAGESTHNIDLD